MGEYKNILLNVKLSLKSHKSQGVIAKDDLHTYDITFV